ncbi:hypothetical protein [Friedmanniella luteola]|uniref:hypothetical protein n=1 Tax=Friedmanniella luteola TaxID=546871 RepID=UPI0012FD09E7|nr:hypothetical protein [Friedmanniella luteola]
MLLDALADAELVGVAAALDRHLGRRATRVELTAARRTAAGLAADGQLTLHQVRVHPGQQAGGGVFLVAARPGVDLDEGRLQQAALGRTPPAQDPAAAERERRTVAHHLARAVAGLREVAAEARAVDVDHLPPEQAARLADQLTAEFSEVRTLQQRLRRRGQHEAARPEVSRDE